MTRQSTDKEGGREVVGKMTSESTGMRRDLEKTHGRGGGLVTGLRVPGRATRDLKMEHKERAHGPFHGVGSRASTRREDGKY